MPFASQLVALLLAWGCGLLGVCGAAQRLERAAPPPSPGAVALQRALLALPDGEVTRASCRPATSAERRAAPFGAWRRTYTCQIAVRRAPPERFAVQVLANGCFVAERHRRGQAVYGCEPRDVDLGGGVRAPVPAGWTHAPAPVTDLVRPVDRGLVASYPARPGGSCAPTRAARELPPDGALVFLAEYADRRGRPTIGLAGLPAGGAHLHLGRPARLECWGVPVATAVFRDAGRAFQVFVAYGPRAPASRRREVRGILDGLRVSPAR